MARFWGLHLSAWDWDWDAVTNSISELWEWNRPWPWDWHCDWDWNWNWNWNWNWDWNQIRSKSRLDYWKAPQKNLENLLAKIVPGFRYCATFFIILRTNIHLSTATCILTPMTTPPLSPLPRSLPQSLPDSIPTLTTHIATTPEDKIAALRLVADSVAQQRQLASRALISHPLPVAFAFLLLGILAQYLAWPIMFTTSAGVVMALLVAVRGATGGYLVAAEKVGWAWLQETGNGDDPDDEVRGKGKGADETVVLVTVWGKEIIGTVVVKMLKKERKALVRAWTVRLRFRGKGVGKSLLEEAVRLAIVDKGSRGVEFDKGHANSVRILPSIFNFGFEKRDRKAQACLAEIVKAQKRG